jgi:hypothetical protein
MKTILSDAGVFGPFRAVQVLQDRFRADGIDFQFDVLGNYEVVLGAPEPPAAQPAVPEAVPMLNARMAMYDAGWLTPWENALAAMSGEDGDRARIKWATALTVRRDDPLVAIGIATLGKTDVEADELFVAAAALNP